MDRRRPIIFQNFRIFRSLDELNPLGFIIFAGAFLLGILLWRLESQPPQQALVISQENLNLNAHGITRGAEILTSQNSPFKSKKSENISSIDQQEVARKIGVLKEILSSKNDNDSRLDTDFNHLTSLDKAALIQEYEKFSPESLNEKGTIVFLLGRNLKTEEDLEFFKSVLNEPDCLGLSNCKGDNSEVSQDNQEKTHDNSYQTIHGSEDSSLGVSITLEYPKLSALKSIEKNLEDPSWPLRSQAIQILSTAAHSENLVVRRLAESILPRYHS